MNPEGYFFSDYNSSIVDLVLYIVTLYKHIRDLKIGRRDELGRLPEVNLQHRACARELLPRLFADVVSSRTPFREFCRRVENVSIFILF